MTPAPPRRRSIRRQLIVTITGIHMVLMASFVFDLIDRQQHFLVDRARSRTLYQAGVLASGSIPQFTMRDFAGLQEIVQAVSQATAIRSVSVTDRMGRILGDSDQRKLGLYLQDEMSKRILQGDAVPQLFNEGPTTVSAAAPIVVGQEVRGWAWVDGDLQADAAQIQAVRRTGLIYILIAIASGALVSSLLATRITRQLRFLREGTRRLAEDRLDEPVPVVTDNDVGVVARAFNDAMKRIARDRAQLVQARNRLEAEVRERRRAEVRLQDANLRITGANEHLKQFAYAASHDLQEPLRAIAAYSELLKRRYSGRLDSEADEFINYIYEGAERMRRLIKALLEYSRAGAPGEEPAGRIESRRALDTALENLATALTESGAKVCAGILPPVWAHEIAVVQVFQNLIGNAIKYAREDTPPEIHITAEECGDECLFAIRDNGIGIAPEHHERIFRIFKRAHAAKYPGTGVGLAICSRIVERYGGRIWVESMPGNGATFRFTLPLSASSGDFGDVGKLAGIGGR